MPGSFLLRKGRRIGFLTFINPYIKKLKAVHIHIRKLSKIWSETAKLVSVISIN